MTAASNSESRKRNAPVVDALEVVVRALAPVIPNTDGTIWYFEHEDGQSQPVTLTDAARDAVGALRVAGLLS